MVKYILEDMLRVRNLRKDTAERNVKQAQHLLEEANTNLQKAKKALEDYRVFVDEETERMYQKIMMQKIKRGAVDDLHYAIKILKNKLITHEQTVESEKENVKKAECNLEEKKELLNEATKNVEKIESHKEEWMKAALKEEEMVADKELEEFTPKKKEY